MRWAMAASVVLMFGLVIVPLLKRLTPFGSGAEAVVQAVEGPVFLVGDFSAQAIKVGDQLKSDERVRTSKEAGAVIRLADGSLIETRERSEFYISQNGEGTTIHLDRGSVIVQAAKQRNGHLFVATNDCLVSVTGTVFSVNSGTKGSRVSVIEGEVHVDHGNAKDVLHPGDQVSTRSNLEPVPVQEEVAWSRDAERYAKLLAGIKELRRDLASQVSVPGVRYSTRLLDVVPEKTAFYAALPNLSNTIVESYRVVQQQVAKNEALREWWERKDGKKGQGTSGSGSADARVQEVVEKVRQFGTYLGDEIVVSVALDASSGHPSAPLVIAELSNAQGFRAALEAELREATNNSTDNKGPRLRFIEDPLLAQKSPDVDVDSGELCVWIRDDLFAASPKIEQLKQLAINLQSPQSNAFRGTSFYARLAQVYRDGAGLIVGADLQQVLASSLAANNERRVKAMDQLGVTNLQHFILELKEKDGRGSNRAVLSFSEPRRGMASWLAEPGPMGALKFISPDANMVASFVVKEPTALVNDLLSALQTIDPALQQHLATFEQENNLDVRRDLAAPLGGEFAFAIDGPMLPSPSWKMIFEVNDAARLQQTFEHVVERLNALSARENRRGFEWTKAEGHRRAHILHAALRRLRFRSKLRLCQRLLCDDAQQSARRPRHSLPRL
ncbi:MAG: FecR domain-containing protein [Pyrinomonadaceae bacterium]